MGENHTLHSLSSIHFRTFSEKPETVKGDEKSTNSMQDLFCARAIKDHNKPPFFLKSDDCFLDKRELCRVVVIINIGYKMAHFRILSPLFLSLTLGGGSRAATMAFEKSAKTI